MVKTPFHYVELDNGCWQWGGATIYGYAYKTLGRRTYRVHKLMYESLIGLVEPDKVLDHICRNRACINPEHLEPVDPRENVIRGNGIAAVNNRKTHCNKGHEFTTENTYYHPKRNTRDCRKCRDIASNKWRLNNVN